MYMHLTQSVSSPALHLWQSLRTCTCRS